MSGTDRARKRFNFIKLQVVIKFATIQDCTTSATVAQDAKIKINASYHMISQAAKMYCTEQM